MNQINSARADTQKRSLGKKSWTAYVNVALLSFSLLLVATPLAWYASTIAGIGLLFASLCFIAYKFLLLKSFDLYIDDAGIWLFYGVLPWNKGVAGVKWRDLDEAVYAQSMGSWLLKSYSIRIGHRFTKSNEIVLTHWAQGHEAVMTINERHQKLAHTSNLN